MEHDCYIFRKYKKLLIFSEYTKSLLYLQNIPLWGGAATTTATATATAVAEEFPICPPTHPTRPGKNIPVRDPPHSDKYIYIYIVCVFVSAFWGDVHTFLTKRVLNSFMEI